MNLPWYCGQASVVAPERAATKTTSNALASSPLMPSTPGKWWTILLSRSAWSCKRLKDRDGAQTSLRRSKNAVQIWSGSGLLPVVSIERELATGQPASSRGRLAWLRVSEVDHHPAAIAPGPLKLSRREVLPEFASPDYPLRQSSQTCSQAPKCCCSRRPRGAGGSELIPFGR